MSERRFWEKIRVRIIVSLDQFLSWPPLIQLPVLIFFTGLLVAFWALVAVALTDLSSAESFWFALTHFLDGGVMAADQGDLHRSIAVGVTVTGVLGVSFLTGAFASKLGERIGDLRSGRSAISADRHILILGFDPKVPLIVHSLAQSAEALTVVVLAKEEKSRMEAMLRFATRGSGRRIRLLCRTGDPTSEISLHRVCADRARTVIIPAPARGEDERALHWAISVLLSLRRAVGEDFRGRVVVESRRASHAPLLMLTGEPGLAGEAAIPVDVFASDDVIARVLAQSVRQSGVYFALRELLSFEGSELYVEPIPRELIGRSFEEAHSRIEQGIAVGVLRADGSHQLAPPATDRPLGASDRLIVLEENSRTFELGHPTPAATSTAPTQPLSATKPQRVVVIGSNRTLPRLITELDRLLVKNSWIEIYVPESELEESVSAPPGAACTSVRLDLRPILDQTLADPSFGNADAVVILGCEDDEDPEADASAISLLLRLRHAHRQSGKSPRRLITEVRDPVLARQIANSVDDFLVSTDVVAMLLAQVSLDPRVASIYRGLLDPTGVEVFLVPLGVYSNEPQPVFAEIMAAARKRGEIAIGYFPHRLGQETRDPPGWNPVRLNPGRLERVSAGPETAIVVFADPPDGPR